MTSKPHCLRPSSTPGATSRAASRVPRLQQRATALSVLRSHAGGWCCGLKPVRKTLSAARVCALSMSWASPIPKLRSTWPSANHSGWAETARMQQSARCGADRGRLSRLARCSESSNLCQNRFPKRTIATGRSRPAVNRSLAEKGGVSARCRLISGASACESTGRKLCRPGTPSARAPRLQAGGGT